MEKDIKDKVVDESLAVLKMQSNVIESYRVSEKRSFIIIIILIAVLVFTNVSWLVYLYQYDFETTTTTVKQDTQDGGNANYINGNGDIDNGEARSQKNNQQEN